MRLRTILLLAVLLYGGFMGISAVLEVHADGCFWTGTYWICNGYPSGSSGGGTGASGGAKVILLERSSAPLFGYCMTTKCNW